MRTVLVTGGTGFIGSHVVDALVSRGDRVLAMVRPTSDPRWLARHPDDRCTRVIGTLFDLSGFEKFSDEITHVVHSAGVVKARTIDGYFRGNAAGTRRLVRFAVVLPHLRRFVHVSSQAASGPAADRGKATRPSDPPKPVNAYGRSKLEAERAVLADASRLNAVVVRPPSVFGPRDTEMLQYFASVKRHVVPVAGFRRTAMSFVHSTDLAGAIVDAMDADVPPGRVYFAADPRVSSWEEFGRIAARALGTWAVAVRIPRLGMFAIAAVNEYIENLRGRAATLSRDKAVMGVKPYWVCDPSETMDELGWRPAASLEDRIAETARWYVEHSWL